MELREIVDLVQIIGIVAILFGIWLGIKQLKLLRNQRRDFAIMECARAFEDKEFTEAYGLLSELKVGLSKKEINAMDKNYELSALRTGMKFETIGLLVYKGVVPIDTMEDLVGGAAIKIWKILENWVYDTRANNEHPLFMEWFEWLVDQLLKRGEETRKPAFIKYKNWKAPD